MDKNYKNRCKDCAYLIEGYSGNWICDAFSEYCENIKKCVNVDNESEECKNEEIL